MKKFIIALIIILVLILLIPIPNHLKDGGTVEYKALLYKISKVHKLISLEEMEEEKKLKNMMKE